MGDAVRLLRSNPLTGDREERCYFVVRNGHLLGRVRYNDGWTAAYAVGDDFEHLAGTYRTRYTAVEGVLYEAEGEGVAYECPTCGGALDFVAVEGDGDSSFICRRCGDEWAGSTLGYPVQDDGAVT